MKESLDLQENKELYENHKNKPCKDYDVNRRLLADTSAYFDYNDLTGRVSFIPKKLADAIIQQRTFLTNKQSEEIFYYSKGIYKPKGNLLIHAMCARELGEEYRRNYALEVIDYIKATTYTKFKEPPPSLINFKNGILCMKTLTLKPHSQTHIFLNQIPHNWNPKATCTEWEKFFDEVTGCDEDRELLIFSLAYCLYRARPFDKSIMLIGVGSNGKTVLLNGFRELLGKENTSSRTIHELCYDRFASADLVGKLANISGDLSNSKLGNTGIFKRITGKDPMTVQKKFLHSEQADIYVKLIFATNQPPEPKTDVSLAFFRRWNLITFPHIFMGDEKDSYKIDKLTTTEELEGLAVKLVASLKQLIEQGGFPEVLSVEEIKQAYMRKANPIQSFTEDCIFEKEGGLVRTEELYKAYSDYCKNHHYSAEGKNKFKNLIEKLGYLYGRKENKRGFVDIEIRGEPEPTQPTLIDYPPEQKEPARNAIKTAVPKRKKLDTNNLKLPLMQHTSKSGKSGMNNIEDLFGTDCENCGEPLPFDESKIIFYKGKPYHTNCHAIFSEETGLEGEQ